jgi:hypothetical protein
MKHSLRFLLFLLPAAVVGCGQVEKEVYALVKGKVNYNGKPIQNGEITFDVPGRPPHTMQIVDGEFSGQAMVGKNRIAVRARKKSDKGLQVKGGAAAAKDAQTQISGYMKFKREFGTPAPEYDPAMVEYLPPEWSTDSRQFREVIAGAPNEFEFNIKGKN